MSTAALDDFEVEGIGHNLPFLSAVMQHDRFPRSGNITTAFIAEEFPDGFHGVAPDRRLGAQAGRRRVPSFIMPLQQRVRCADLRDDRQPSPGDRQGLGRHLCGSRTRRDADDILPEGAACPVFRRNE